MKLRAILAVAAIIALPVAAQGQPKGAPKATKADAQKVVQSIKGDPAKVKAYCDMAKLSDQAQQADEKKDQKKLDELSKQMDALAEKLGPDYAKLMDAMQDVDPNSKLAEDINATMDDLDKQCK